jgi:hypothetical protein
MFPQKMTALTIATRDTSNRLNLQSLNIFRGRLLKLLAAQSLLQMPQANAQHKRTNGRLPPSLQSHTLGVVCLNHFQ